MLLNYLMCFRWSDHKWSTKKRYCLHLLLSCISYASPVNRAGQLDSHPTTVVECQNTVFVCECCFTWKLWHKWSIKLFFFNKINNRLGIKCYIAATETFWFVLNDRGTWAHKFQPFVSFVFCFAIWSPDFSHI